MQARVGNGEQVMSKGSCKRFRIAIQGVVLTLDLYVLALVGCDMILGV